MNTRKRIAVASNKNVGLTLLMELVEAGFEIALIINLEPNHPMVQNVAGYYDLKAFGEKEQIPVYRPKRYSLKSQEDQDAVLAYECDLLICIGWQRLIPEWLLESLKNGSYGMHGSSDFLPHGRGRSPMNWCLIEGRKRFITHLIRHDSGVDSGNVIDYQAFDINEWDDIETLHYKNTISEIQLLKANLPRLMSENYSGKPQEGEPDYEYPKRTPKDGIINWESTTWDLFNFIRAQTKPFPGAFSSLDTDGSEIKVYFWKAQPFDSHLKFSDATNGEIVQVMYSGEFVVKTVDGSLLIREFSLSESCTIEKGMIFSNRADLGNVE